MSLLTGYEKETIICYNEEEKTANVYTYNKRLMSKLTESCRKFPEQFQLEAEDAESKTFNIPKKYISIRTPKPSRIYTEEEKEVLRERMKKLHSDKAILNSPA